MVNKKEPITVIDDIPGGTTETYEYTFPVDGTITGVGISTYVGHEFDLRYTLEIREETDDNTYNLLNPLGKSFLAGNGEEFDLPIRYEFSKDDTLIIKVENNEPDYLYHASARIAVDYEDMGGLMEMINGVFH